MMIFVVQIIGFVESALAAGHGFLEKDCFEIAVLLHMGDILGLSSHSSEFLIKTCPYSGIYSRYSAILCIITCFSPLILMGRLEKKTSIQFNFISIIL